MSATANGACLKMRKPRIPRKRSPTQRFRLLYLIKATETQTGFPEYLKQSNDSRDKRNSTESNNIVTASMIPEGANEVSSPATVLPTIASMSTSDLATTSLLVREDARHLGQRQLPPDKLPPSSGAIPLNPNQWNEIDPVTHDHHTNLEHQSSQAHPIIAAIPHYNSYVPNIYAGQYDADMPATNTSFQSSAELTFDSIASQNANIPTVDCGLPGVSNPGYWSKSYQSFSNDFRSMQSQGVDSLGADFSYEANTYINGDLN